MAKKCIPSDPILRNASIKGTSTFLAIEASYSNIFGMPVNELPIAHEAIKILVEYIGLD